MNTSLGDDFQKTFFAVFGGDIGVRKTSEPRVTQSSVTAGIIPEEVYGRLRDKFGDGYTRAELLAAGCAADVLETPHTGRTVLILASAKANVALLEGRCADGSWKPSDDDPVLPGQFALRVAELAGIPREDVMLVSNACISGVSAIVAARRLILSGEYDNAVVVGVDTQNRFITSGFASFKSLSDDVCRPYDVSRCGLNLGEACGALLLTREKVTERCVAIEGGAVTDDANHISGPSRTGDGLFFAMRKAMREAGIKPEWVNMLQMHGTATAYNDDMESKAASLAGLQDVPVQSLKPYFGHTMGASGVIETIIASIEMEIGIVLRTPGFEKLGVPMPLNVPPEGCMFRLDNVLHVLKTASGFGGTNAAVVLEYFAEKSLLHVSGHGPDVSETPARHAADVKVCRTVAVDSGAVKVDGAAVFEDRDADFATFIREAFKSRGGQYMKFYKMDDFCKLAFMAAEWLLDGISFGEEECGIVLSGKYGCLDTDMRHQQIIDAGGDDSASPAVFVYTLPNVAAGEISIRHHIKGENLWMWAADPEAAGRYALLMMEAQDLKYCIVGRFDYIAGEYAARFELLGAF